MAAVFALVCFIIAFIMRIAGWAHGHFDSIAVMMLGLVFFVVAFIWDWRPWVHR